MLKTVWYMHGSVFICHLVACHAISVTLSKRYQNICFSIDINECDTANGGCEHSCTNTIGSFTCSCDTGYQLDGNGLNCSGESSWSGCTQSQRLNIYSHFCFHTDVDECKNSTRCHENANCTNTEGSYSCSCNDGYSGSGTECTGRKLATSSDIRLKHLCKQLIPALGS